MVQHATYSVQTGPRMPQMQVLQPSECCHCSPWPRPPHSTPPARQKRRVQAPPAAVHWQLLHPSTWVKLSPGLPQADISPISWPDCLLVQNARPVHTQPRLRTPRVRVRQAELPAKQSDIWITGAGFTHLVQAEPPCRHLQRLQPSGPM